MPRDLTDLMERATAFAPPESHDAHDVTRTAIARHRRRTAGIAGGLAFAVVVAAALGYGVTRSTPTVPRPATSFVHGQHQQLSDAVSASDAAGFRTLHYDAPSVLAATHQFTALGEYADIDAQGRLLALSLVGHRQVFDTQLAYSVLDGPGQAPRPVAPPPVPGAGQRIHAGAWQARFTDDGRIFWRDVTLAVDNEIENDRVTQLDGSGVQAFQSTLSNVKVQGFAAFAKVREAWVDGDRAWLSLVTRDPRSPTIPVQTVSLYSLDAGASQPTAVDPQAALTIDVSHGEAVWVDMAATRVYAEDLSTGAQHVVPVPLGRGCRIPPRTSYYEGVTSILRTNGDLVALTESCGNSAKIVVADLSGRLVTEVDAGPGNGFVGMDLGDRTLTFGSFRGHTNWYADDLTTGTLVGLGHGSYQNTSGLTTSAGRYVLWYDERGGHVGEFTD